MRKKWIFIIILILILIVSITFLLANTKNYLNYYTHTKAICNKTNYCQDYQISCNNKKVLMSLPLTGATIQHPQNWKDPRNNIDKRLCN